MNICDECPIRLFNTKHHNLKGIGNPYFGNCIVVPNVDYDAYKKGSMGFSEQVAIIKDIIHSSTGEGDNLDYIHIVPLLRCNETISCEVDDASYKRCLTHLAKDIIKYQFTNLLLLGDAAKRLLDCDIGNHLDTILVSKNNRCYNVNYSPLIKYTNEEKYETFKQYLIKWYNYINTRQNTYKNVIKL